MPPLGVKPPANLTADCTAPAPLADDTMGAMADTLIANTASPRGLRQAAQAIERLGEGLVNPDNGTLSVLYSVLKREYHQKDGAEKKRLLVFMGGCMVAMGASMVFRGLEKPKGRSR